MWLTLDSDGVPYMGHSFPALCQMRVILSSAIGEYNSLEGGCIWERLDITYPEQIYLMLLRWADNLDPELRRRPGMSHHVSILQ